MIFNLGDIVWSRNEFTLGNYFPSFCEYEIVDLADLGSESEWAVLLSKHNSIIINAYTKFCFNTKTEAIDHLISKLESMKNE